MPLLWAHFTLLHFDTSAQTVYLHGFQSPFNASTLPIQVRFKARCVALSCRTGVGTSIHFTHLRSRVTPTQSAFCRWLQCLSVKSCMSRLVVCFTSIHFSVAVFASFNIAVSHSTVRSSGNCIAHFIALQQSDYRSAPLTLCCRSCSIICRGNDLAGDDNASTCGMYQSRKNWSKSVDRWCSVLGSASRIGNIIFPRPMF